MAKKKTDLGAYEVTKSDDGYLVKRNDKVLDSWPDKKSAEAQAAGLAERDARA